MLQVKNLSFAYSTNQVLKGLSFEVNRGKTLAVIGESGSGKSTLLKLIYGEFDIKKGEVWWDNKQILGPAFNLVVGYDFMKFVAQEFDLMPYTSVEDNIGKFLSRFYPEEKEKRTNELLKVVELESFAKKKVKNLSGGQKQRVALARALAKEPEILLLDEPFSHIDNFKKQSLRRSIYEYLKINQISCVVATHDKNDVLGFADEMIVLHKKEVVIKDSPERIYNDPKLPLVASFFGEFSVIEGQIYYAHQLKIVQRSEHKAVVKQSYFNGNTWLVQAIYNSEYIFLEHEFEIQPKSEFYFKVMK
ncbi:ABC transporter ATP-binding protein [Winogradskyella alexanderae]|uniref:ABC transporter ATP-binding protein n=1 Tax=Winogradskyella alexanderae TaxID=2877123 RepID=A0ABS7XMI7_9FLAO|nr:ABC transporter ATP-binding protein [Winogradskyella alexanderae]MCA0131217.1 ABC transporter ATP-binding protein [Winogradskyella alexanderae]